MDGSSRLEPSVHRAIFKNNIEPAFLLITQPVDHPKIVVIAAQTGAGKTNLLTKTRAEFHNNAIFVNTDELRRFHPQYDEIGKDDDEKSASRTHEDASAWRDELLASAIKNRRNIILEGVFKDGDGLIKTIGKLKDEGYEIAVRFLAVHRRQSILGVHLRYEEQKALSGHGRFATVEYHDDCYDKLLDTASKVELNSPADTVEVYNRSTECIFAKESSSGGSVKEAIEKERAREMSKEQKKAYQEDWHVVIEAMRNRNAPDERINEVKGLSAQLIKEIS